MPEMEVEYPAGARALGRAERTEKEISSGRWGRERRHSCRCPQKQRREQQHPGFPLLLIFLGSYETEPAQHRRGRTRSGCKASLPLATPHTCKALFLQEQMQAEKAEHRILKSPSGCLLPHGCNR